MSLSEKLCLKWNDYQENIGLSYRELRESQEFGDVTLVCEDNHRIEGHKVILASASKFFRNIFIGNKHSHPLIYMRGIKARDLVCLVDFIYHGEANVYEEDLNNFLAIAEELNLTGLIGSTTSEEAHNSRNETKVRKVKKEGQSNLMVLDSFPNAYTSKPDTFDEDVVNTSFDNTVGVLDVNTVMVAKTSVSFKGENTELDGKINSMLKKINAVWTCTVCGKTDNNNRAYNVKKHIESHIEGLAHPCGHCGKTFRSRNILQSHLSRAHRF